MSDNSSLFCFSTGLSVTAWCNLRKEKQQRSYYQTILLPVSILPIKSLPHELLFVGNNASLWGFSPHSALPFRAQIELFNKLTVHSWVIAHPLFL